MNKKYVLVIASLMIIAIVIIGLVFGQALYSSDYLESDSDFDYKEGIIGKDILNPDRIVYRNSDGEYFEFRTGEDSYNKILALLGNSITTYNKNGEVLSDNEIDDIHRKSFIEFDYKTISKNYIIGLEKNENRAVIKLDNVGGMIVSEKVENLSKINKTLNKLKTEEEAHRLEYKEILSKNSIEYLEYKYQQEFKEINFGIFQSKVTDYEDYEKYSAICNIAIEDKITEETFKNNDVIITVTALPKIDVKVNLGNIKYTYDDIENANRQYNVHLLIVDKIVNTDCIYNTDLTKIKSKVDYDNMKVEYDDSVNNINTDVFVTNYDEFIKQYNKATSEIDLEEARTIAEQGFKEAERICGAYKESTETYEKTTEKANNFFTGKLTDMPETYKDDVEVYSFSRTDDMDLNGVRVFVDRRLGKIVGGAAFGD